MSNYLLGALGGVLPVVSSTTDPNNLLAGLTPTDLTSINLSALGTDLADLAISTHGWSLTLPSSVHLGGVLGTDGNDLIHLGANTVLGSAVLGAGDDSLVAPVDSIVNGTIDAGGGNDSITIGGGNAHLEGGDGNDMINAMGTGNDTIDGGIGADTMIGGMGDDTYIVDNSSDVVTEGANAGTDTIRSSVTFSLAGHEVENLILTGTGNINATGNDDANLLSGNDASNTLDGGLGADTMAGGSGDDVYYVNDAGDQVSEATNAGHDLVHSLISYRLGSNVEDLTLDGSDALNGTGNALANMLQGNSGADVLNGLAGADTMIGGGGNDTYYVDNAHDLVVEQAGGGTDRVRSSISYVLGDNVENLRLTGTASIDAAGNALANNLYGNTTANLLDGGGAADHMFGGKGNDTYIVDNTGDRVIEKAGEGTDTVKSSVSYILGDNVENLTLTGGTANHGTGNALNNVIHGNDIGNVLDGRSGNDIMVGGAGADTIIGGAGKDLETGGAGADTFVFKDGQFGGATTSTADVIKDFSHAQGDKIDLSGVDANVNLSGDQHFSFVGQHAFTGMAGQLSIEKIDGGYYLAGDTNGDAHADFLLKLDALHGCHIQASDLVL